MQSLSFADELAVYIASRAKIERDGSISAAEVRRILNEDLRTAQREDAAPLLIERPKLIE